LALLLSLPALHGSPTSIQTIVDDLPPQTGHEIQIPYTTKQIIFRIGDPPLGENKTARRVRYRLEGIDSEWQNRMGFMAFSVRFYNAAGDQVGQEEFRAVDHSPGWKESVEDSTFTSRREIITAPERAARVCIFISSAGPPTSIGAFVVGDVTISRIGPSGSVKTLLESDTFLRLGNAAPPDSLWIPDGSHPSMARTVTFPPGHEPHMAFEIIDNDPVAHAEWHLIKEQAPTVSPGDKLAIEWKELFNVGPGDVFDIGYGKPPAGRYQFRVEELDTFGNPTKSSNWTELVVLDPFWKTRWFLALAGITALGLLAGGMYFFFRWQLNRRIWRLQQEHMLESERLRIARNIHDDLGARLTQISLVSAMAAKGTPENATDGLHKVTRMTRDLVAALYETVWTVDPKNDHLDSLGTFLCQLIPNMCEPAGIRCRLDVDDLPRDIHVSSETRHHISLIVKEAVHNAVKYSRATEIETKISYVPPRFLVSVRDDGCGFLAEDSKATESSTKARRPSGLENMQNRAAAISGEISIQSVEGKGTIVSLSVPVA